MLFWDRWLGDLAVNDNRYTLSGLRCRFNACQIQRWAGPIQKSADGVIEIYPPPELNYPALRIMYGSDSDLLLISGISSSIPDIRISGWGMLIVSP
jgi:hypothetical protein